jgi:hypothetical protein
MSKQTQDHIVDVNKKVTAVEWLVEQIKEYDFSPRDNTYLIEIPTWILKEKIAKAKEMEKQEIIDAYVKGANNQIYGVDLSGLEYYEQTFNK